MPLNSGMQLLLGATGPVSVDGTVIYQPRGISPAWIRPNVAGFSGLEPDADPQDLSKWHLYQRPNGSTATILHPRGANRFVANESGQWYAWQAGYGLYTAEGLFSTIAYPYACGPNGELVYGDQTTGRGVWVMTADQVSEVIRLSGRPTPILVIPDVVAYDVRSYGGPMVSWRGPDAFTAQLAWDPDPRTWRRPLRIAGEPLYGIVWLVLAGEWWIGYSTGPDVRLRPDQSDTGIVVDAATPHRYYALDFKVAAARDCVTGWALGEGQFPGEAERRVTDVTTAPRVTFAGVSVPSPPLPPPMPTPGPTPTPTPTPTPVPKETAMQLTAREQSVVTAFAARFPVPQRGVEESQADFEERLRTGWTRRLAEQMAFSASPDFGMKRRPNGGPISKDGLARNFPGEISTRWPGRPHFELWDILSGSGTGRPTLNETDDSEDVSDQEFVPVTPRDHLGAGGGLPMPTPGPGPQLPPPPPSSVDLAPVLVTLDQLRVQVAHLAETLTQAYMKIDAMEDRIETILERQNAQTSRLATIFTRQDRPVSGSVRLLGTITLTPQNR